MGVTYLGLAYPKSHDLGYLVRLLERAGADLTSYPGLEDFTVFAVQYRYEAYDDMDAQLDRAEVVSLAGRLVRHVNSLICPV